MPENDIKSRLKSIAADERFKTLGPDEQREVLSRAYDQFSGASNPTGVDVAPGDPGVYTGSTGTIRRSPTFGEQLVNFTANAPKLAGEFLLPEAVEKGTLALTKSPALAKAARIPAGAIGGAVGAAASEGLKHVFQANDPEGLFTPIPSEDFTGEVSRTAAIGAGTEALGVGLGGIIDTFRRIFRGPVSKLTPAGEVADSMGIPLVPSQRTTAAGANTIEAVARIGGPGRAKLDKLTQDAQKAAFGKLDEQLNQLSAHLPPHEASVQAVKVATGIGQSLKKATGDEIDKSLKFFDGTPTNITVPQTIKSSLVDASGNPLTHTVNVAKTAMDGAVMVDTRPMKQWLAKELRNPDIIPTRVEPGQIPTVAGQAGRVARTAENFLDVPDAITFREAHEWRSAIGADLRGRTTGGKFTGIKKRLFGEFYGQQESASKLAGKLPEYRAYKDQLETYGKLAELYDRGAIVKLAKRYPERMGRMIINSDNITPIDEVLEGLGRGANLGGARISKTDAIELGRQDPRWQVIVRDAFDQALQGARKVPNGNPGQNLTVWWNGLGPEVQERMLGKQGVDETNRLMTLLSAPTGGQNAQAFEKGAITMLMQSMVAGGGIVGGFASGDATGAGLGLAGGAAVTLGGSYVAAGMLTSPRVRRFLIDNASLAPTARNILTAATRLGQLLSNTDRDLRRQKTIAIEREQAAERGRAVLPPVPEPALAGGAF